MGRIRFRFTLRAVMAVVLLCGLLSFGWVMVKSTTRYRSRALWWGQTAAGQREHLAFCQQQIEGILRAAGRIRSELRNLYQPEELERRNADEWLWWRANRDHTEKTLAYCTMLQRKYEVASRYPWFSVEPDPPAPYWSGVTGPATAEEIESLVQESVRNEDRTVQPPGGPTESSP
ncbi:MAG: hypothetical protein U0790_13565 [Isosphaeraceae bacterium]